MRKDTKRFKNKSPYLIERENYFLRDFGNYFCDNSNLILNYNIEKIDYKKESCTNEKKN